MSKLEIFGPTRQGLLDQFFVSGWKFVSKRFGLQGRVFQCSIEYTIDDKIKRNGQKTMRRYEGHNGWLWHTISLLEAKISQIEFDRDTNYTKKPIHPNILQKIGWTLIKRFDK